MAKAKDPSAPLNLPTIAPPAAVAATAPVAAKPATKPPASVASFTQLVCAATQQRVRISTSGVWTQAEEDLAHPVGWGRLTLIRVLPNPAVADHEAQRAALVQQAVEMTQALAESPSTPEAQRAMLTQQLADGTTAEEAEAHFDQQHPAPDETVTLTIAWDVSAAGFVAVDDALGALGFVVPNPLGEEGA